jgi:hypothetical protein
MLGGTLRFEGEEERTLGVGWVGALGLSWRVLEDEGLAPYIVFSATVAGLGTRVEGPGDQRASYYGVDGRFGATLGKTFAGVVSPYLSLRVFGGPVILDELDADAAIGTDKYHVQPAIGLVFLLPGGIDIYADVAPVLERSILGGVGLVF